jgi:hypothetical protein
MRPLASWRINAHTMAQAVMALQIYHIMAANLRRHLLRGGDGMMGSKPYEQYVLDEIRYRVIVDARRPLEILCVVNGKMPYEAFADVEAEALRMQNTDYANAANECADLLRMAAGLHASVDEARRHEGLVSAVFLAYGGVVVGDEDRLMRELAQEVWAKAALLKHSPECDLGRADRVVRCLRRALYDTKTLHPATLSAQPFVDVEHAVSAREFESPRVVELQQACAECARLIHRAKAPYALAVMQGATPGRVGRESLLQQLDAELVRRLILRAI